MCTCITIKTKDTYFGRTMDIDYNFGEKIVITPKNYKFNLKNGTTFYTKYAIVGIASVINDYPLYADACNESGLAIAGLSFPDNAYYKSPDKDKLNLASYEVIPYILGNFETVDEILKKANNINITNIAFSSHIPPTDLHWMVSDNKKSIVLEQLQNGLKIYENEIEVLTNNPPFEYQLTHINNYLNISPDVAINRFSKKLNLKPYGAGMGAIGLPGDNSPESRFVRATFNKCNSLCNLDDESSITQFFHILDSVSVINGTIVKDNKANYKTIYSCCINLNRKVYYYKTYNNNQITAVNLKIPKNRKYLTIYNLNDTQQIKYLN